MLAYQAFSRDVGMRVSLTFDVLVRPTPPESLLTENTEKYSTIESQTTPSWGSDVYVNREHPLLGKHLDPHSHVWQASKEASARQYSKE